MYLKFDVAAVVGVKNSNFWNVIPCSVPCSFVLSLSSTRNVYPGIVGCSFYPKYGTIFIHIAENPESPVRLIKYTVCLCRV